MRRKGMGMPVDVHQDGVYENDTDNGVSLGAGEDDDQKHKGRHHTLYLREGPEVLGPYS